MGISKKQLSEAITCVAERDRHVERALAQVGLPEPRIGEPGFASLLRILVGQQLSVKAAASIRARMEALLGEVTPQAVLATGHDALRGAGLSRAKAVYAHALAEAVNDGRLEFSSIAQMEHEEAISTICSVKGFGPWSAEIYLLFCEGRMDIWPSGDLALQAALQRLKRMRKRPSAKETVPIVKRWRPFRGAMAVFLWHYYAKTEAPL